MRALEVTSAEVSGRDPKAEGSPGEKSGPAGPGAQGPREGGRRCSKLRNAVKGALRPGQPQFAAGVDELGEPALIGCASPCIPPVKLQAAARKLPTGPARDELQALADEVKNGGLSQARVNEIGDRVKAIAAQNPEVAELKELAEVGGKTAGSASKAMNVGDAEHHVPAVRKSRGRPFEVERTDLSRPTIHVIGDKKVVGEAHWRMHNAEPGNGLWYSDRTEVNAVTGGKPIRFVNGRPDFSDGRKVVSYLKWASLTELRTTSIWYT